MAKITGTAAKNGYGFYAILTETLGENYLSENASTVKYEVYIVNGNKRTNSSNWTFNAKIDGSNVYNDTTAKLVTNDTDYNTAKKLFSGSEVIKHNSDGKKTITFSATLTKSSYGSYDPGKCSLSGTFKLTDIPRASTLTTANTYITFGESFRIDIDRKVNTYTDTITWVGYYPKDNGDGSYNLQSDTPSNIKGTIVEKTSESYVEWSIPDEVTSLIPTLRFVGVKLICTTYNGDTVIGTTEKWVYGRLLEDFSKPLINYTHKETYSRLINQIGNDNFSIPVLNLSQPKFTFGATPRYNATIKSINISCGDGQTSTTSPYTFNPIGNAIFTITAVDSRDYQTILVVDLSKNALPYIRPTIKTLEPTRLSPISGEIILNAKGSWYGGTMIDDIANPLYASYKCKVSGSDEDPILVDIPSDAITLDEERNEWSITNLNLGEITEYNKNYNFNLFISDYYIDLESSKLIRKGISTFNAGEKDFQVNGDLFVADEDGLNKVNVIKTLDSITKNQFTGTTRENTVVGSYVRLFTLDFAAWWKSTSIWFTISDTQSSGENVLCNIFAHSGGDGVDLNFYTLRYLDTKGSFDGSRLVGVVTATKKLEVYYKMISNDSPTLNIISHSRHKTENQYGLITVDMNTVVSSVPTGSSTISATMLSDYRIGDVIITSTNTNPASTYGGTWTLIDKEFAPKTGQVTFTKTNYTSATLAMSRQGHSIYCRLTFVNSTTLNDTDTVIGTASLSELGVTDLTYAKYPIAWTDGGGGILFMQAGSDGVIKSFDVIDKGGTHSMSAGKTFYVDWVNEISMGSMLDSACDKFYWKRTA